MSILKRLLTFSGLITLAACSHGMRPQSFPPAISASGATVKVRVVSEARDRTGELFASDSSGLIVLSDRLLRIRWDQLVRVRVPGIGSYRLDEGSMPSDRTRHELALISRFPHGLSGDRLAEVLTALKQPALESIGAPAARAASPRSTPDSDDAGALDALADASARESARYADRTVAVADGYRRIGTDFPGMGEHWVNVGTLLSGQIDPARPTMLVYAQVLGVPTLVGLGFVLTTTGDAAPPLAPGWPTEWHEHSGLIGDESVGRAPHGSGPDAERSTRVWVLHIWNAVENPAGRYMADNWALPFARAGLVPPAVAEPEAGRAFSLAVGGDAFFIAMLADAGFMREPATRQMIDALVTSAQADALEVARRAASRASRQLSADDVAALRTAWRTLERGLVTTLGPDVARYIGTAAHDH